MAKLAALAASLLLYSPSALAWGGLGHQAICELAFLEVEATTRQRVIDPIRLDQEFTTFRASCNWPDRPRQRASEHFVNLPRDATGLDDQECPLADKCVVSAIKDDFAVLASPDATDEDKLAALKFLGHRVGDIHQPLHAASGDDRGGNHIRMRGSSCESLHTLWDSCLVEERLGMHPLTIVRALRAGITDEQRAEVFGRRCELPLVGRRTQLRLPLFAPENAAEQRAGVRPRRQRSRSASIGGR